MSRFTKEERSDLCMLRTIVTLRLFLTVLIYPFIYIYAWNIVNNLCHEYRIANMPRIRLTILNRRRIGVYVSKSNTIYIDIFRCFYKKHIKMTLRHEFRHAWQYRYCREMMKWWSSHNDVYKKYYFSPLCVIEVDANRFAETDNSDRYAIDSVSVDELDYAYQTDQLDELNLIVDNRQSPLRHPHLQ